LAGVGLACLQQPSRVGSLVTLVSCGLILAFSLTFLVLLSHMKRLIPWNPKSRLSHAFSQIVTGTRLLNSHLFQSPRQMVVVSVLTIAIHLSTVGLFVTVDRGLGCQHSWWLYLAIVPMVSLASCIPSLNGLIVFEGSAIILMNQLGNISPTTAFTLCGTIRLLDLLTRLAQCILLWVPPGPTIPQPISRITREYSNCPVANLTNLSPRPAHESVFESQQQSIDVHAGVTGLVPVANRPDEQVGNRPLMSGTQRIVLTQ